MENFLKKIKLIDSFSTTINTSKSVFTSALRNHVDEADIDGLFSGAFDAFTSSKNLYKGSVNHNGFRIRKRRRLFDRNFSKALAIGELKEQGDTLRINTKINAWSNYMFPFFGFASIFYLIFFSVMIGQGFSGDSGISFVASFFVLIHAGFMFGIPYFMMRRSVKIMKEDLEREFHFIISKSNTLK